MYIFPEKLLIVVRMQAPKNQYTGKNESKGYREKALKIFKKLLN